MHRTQLYLDDDLVSVLRLRARETGVTMSELVRIAVRDRYLTPAGKRKEAMLGIAGIWKDRADLPETPELVQSLRTDSRQRRLEPQ